MKRARILFPLALIVGCATHAQRTSAVINPAAMTPPTASAETVAADDPTTTDPDKYKVAFENERLRVLRYHDSPGGKTTMHRHPDSMLYALSSFRRRISFPDGTSRVVELQAGAAMWVPAQTHIGENIGGTDCDVLLVEPKR